MSCVVRARRVLVSALVVASVAPTSRLPAQRQPPAQQIRPASQFDVDLFRAVAAAAPHQNVFISPLSAYVAMAMAYDGAAGETRTAIGHAMGIDPRRDDQPDRAIEARLRSLRGSRDATVSVANALWLRRDAPVEPAYLARMRGAFDASVNAVDLTSPATVTSINAWVSQATHGRITAVLGAPMSDLATALLVNAIYFKGTWKQQFEPERTRPRPFHLERGKVVQRTAMSLEGSFSYSRRRGFQAVRLPYRGGQFSMVVMLPDSGVSDRLLVDALVPGAASSWMESMTGAEVVLQLPKFRLEQEVDLVKPLVAMGMASAFDARRADFSRMLPVAYLHRRNVYIDAVKQKTFVDVNEEGTVAAAATSVSISADSAAPERVAFIVDRPFMIVLRDDTTRTILFLGWIVDPKPA